MTVQSETDGVTVHRQMVRLQSETDVVTVQCQRDVVTV